MKERERHSTDQSGEERLQEKKPIPPFVVDASGIPTEGFIPFGFSELYLLGLGNYATNKLRGAGIHSIREFYDADEERLIQIKYFGEKRLQEGKATLKSFRDEVETLTQERSRTVPGQQPDEIPIVINAIDWFRSHHLAWDGTPKTALMSEIEKYIGEDLGIFLNAKYTQEGLSVQQVSDEIYSLSNTELRVKRDFLNRMMERFGVKRRSKEELALQQVKPLSQRELPLPEPARKGRASEKQIAAVRSLLQRARETSILSQLPERDKYLLTTRFGGNKVVALESIADTLGISKGVVAQRQTRAIIRLRALVEKMVY